MRHIRVPQSFRNDTEEFVKWRIHGDSDRAISYTLKGLAELVGGYAHTEVTVGTRRARLDPVLTGESEKRLDKDEPESSRRFRNDQGPARWRVSR
jgi:hypothetical protein